MLNFRWQYIVELPCFTCLLNTRSTSSTCKIYRSLLKNIFFCIVLRPNDPNFVVGENLKLRCTLSPSSSYTVDDVEFEFETLIRDARYRQSVHVKFTRVANNTLHLIIPNITLEYDRATFSCFIKGRREYIDSQIVRVGCTYLEYQWCNIIYLLT